MELIRSNVIIVPILSLLGDPPPFSYVLPTHELHQYSSLARIQSFSLISYMFLRPNLLQFSLDPVIINPSAFSIVVSLSWPLSPGRTDLLMSHNDSAPFLFCFLDMSLFSVTSCNCIRAFAHLSLHLDIRSALALSSS